MSPIKGGNIPSKISQKNLRKSKIYKRGGGGVKFLGDLKKTPKVEGWITVGTIFWAQKYQNG